MKNLQVLKESLVLVSLLFFILTGTVYAEIWAKFVNADIWSVQPTTDGGSIVAGTNLLSKFDGSGNIQWARSYGGDGLIFSQQTTDGGYIATGMTGWFGVFGK